MRRDAAGRGARHLPVARARRPGRGGAERAWRRSCTRSRTRASPSIRLRQASRISRRGSSGSTAASSPRSGVRSRQSGPSGTRGSAPPDGASPRSPQPPSHGRARRSSSPTRSCRSSSRRCRSRSCRSSAAVTKSLKRLEFASLGQLAGLPGGAVAERWGRRPARRAWREVGRPRACAVVARPFSLPRHSSSRKRSGTSSH